MALPKTILLPLLLALTCAAVAQTSDSPPPALTKAGPGVTPPRALYSPTPEFSDEARKARYQGTSILKLIVEADGKPGHIRSFNFIGMGLDEKAIEAVQQWRFQPARKDGEPVRYEVAVEVDFR